MSSKRIAIIGAGITGLSLAYFLSKKGYKIDVFEKEKAPGGLAGSFNLKGLLLDRFYHHFYTGDTDLISLIENLGLAKEIVWESTPTGMYFANKSYRLSTPIDLLKFSPLPFADRLKMGFLAMNAQKLKSTKELDHISAKDWVIQAAGKKVYDIMWEPLLRNKFGRHAENVSAEWLCSKFMKRGASRTKGGKETLGYLKGGLCILFERLMDVLLSRKVNIQLEMQVQKIEIENEQARRLTLASGETLEYDTIISTVSTLQTATLLGNQFSEYKDSLQKIEYLSNISLIMLLSKSLSDYYWLNINNPECPFVGVIEHTKLIDSSHYKGLHLVYISKYLPKTDKFYSMNENELFSNYLPWLKQIFPNFDEKDILARGVCKDLYAQPIITKGYRKLIPQVETPIKNFYLTTMAQIYPEDRQMSNSVRNASELAAKMVTGE